MKAQIIATISRPRAAEVNAIVDATKPRHDRIREVARTTQDRRDLKREIRSRPEILSEVDAIIDLLATGQALPARLRDHRMVGAGRDFRDLHVKPDIVLLYHLSKSVIVLTPIGSHAELFG